MKPTDEWTEAWTSNIEDARVAYARARFDLEQDYFPRISKEEMDFLEGKYPELKNAP